jgi:hypothetical protein
MRCVDNNRFFFFDFFINLFVNDILLVIVSIEDVVIFILIKGKQIIFSSSGYFVLHPNELDFPHWNVFSLILNEVFLHHYRSNHWDLRQKHPLEWDFELQINSNINVNEKKSHFKSLYPLHLNLHPMDLLDQSQLKNIVNSNGQSISMKRFLLGIWSSSSSSDWIWSSIIGSPSSTSSSSLLWLSYHWSIQKKRNSTFERLFSYQSSTLTYVRLIDLFLLDPSMAFV